MIPRTGDGFIAAWLRFGFKCLPEGICGGDHPEQAARRIKTEIQPLENPFFLVL